MNKILRKLEVMKTQNNCFGLQTKDHINMKSQYMDQNFKVVTIYTDGNKDYTETELFLSDLCYYYRQIDQFSRFCIDLNNVKKWGGC